MEKPSTVLTKFKSYKAENTKVWLWLDTLDRTRQTLSWRLPSLGGRRGASTPPAPQPAPPLPGRAPGRALTEQRVHLQIRDRRRKRRWLRRRSRQEPGSTSMSLAAAAAAAAAANIRREQEREQDKGREEGEHVGEEVPEWWVFPFLLLTAAYSPWSGQAPSEWKHLDSSDGPSKKRKGADVTVDSENPVCSPAVMSRLNPNGDALSRRQHFAAIKREKEQEMKAAAEKELQEARKEPLETKKGLAAFEAANTHVETIGADMKRMVELKEAEAVGIKRENKIKALEKKIVLRLGDETENRAELVFLLIEFELSHYGCCVLACDHCSKKGGCLFIISVFF
ncbi:unnamed protein product [Ectocarpus sp. CCAP 1310/34]|nr:unnamed protein product [Ectocarpus sp. CCAP 1310/34]